MTKVSWTKEKVAALLRYTREGKSAAEIGRKFGLTRSAVLGKLFRVRAKEGEDIAPRMITGRPKGEVKPKAAPTAPKITKDKTDKERQRQIYAVLNRAGKYLKSTGFNPTPKPISYSNKYSNINTYSNCNINTNSNRNQHTKYYSDNNSNTELCLCVQDL